MCMNYSPFVNHSIPLSISLLFSLNLYQKVQSIGHVLCCAQNSIRMYLYQWYIIKLKSAAIMNAWCLPYSQLIWAETIGKTILTHTHIHIYPTKYFNNIVRWASKTILNPNKSFCIVNVPCINCKMKLLVSRINMNANAF